MHGMTTGGPGVDAVRRVVVVGYPGSELLDIAFVTSTLDLSGRIAGRVLYRIELVSSAGRVSARNSAQDH